MFKSIFSRAIPFYIASSISLSAHAAIDEVVVTAKTNQTLADVLPTSHVLTSADILSLNAIDLPDLLDHISGINITPTGGRGSTTGVFIRGTSTSQTIILIDGIRVGSATLGQAALNSYPLDAIERIEVIKGPLSAIYGADAVGGVIQIFTKSHLDGLGIATVTIGSDSLFEYGLTLGAGNENNGFIISAHAQDTDGIDHTSLLTDDNDDLDAYEETSFSLAARGQLSDSTKVKLSILSTDNKVDVDNPFFGSGFGLMNETKTLSSALNLSTEFSEQLTWTTTLGLNNDEFSANGDFPSVFTTDRESLASELSFKVSNTTSITLGVDYYSEDIETGTTTFPTTGRDNKGAFGLFQSDFGKASLVASFRYDDNSAYGSDTNGSIAANYDFSDDLRLVLSYGTGFVAPSFNFLYFPFFGNPDLLAEESDSLELSLLGQKGNMEWRVSAYKTDIKNLFSFDPNTFLAANISSAEIKGVEFEVSTQIAEWQLHANLDLLSAKDAITGGKLDDRAETSLLISASRELDKFRLSFDLRAENGRHDLRGTELSSYGLFDIRAAYEVNDDFTISAKMENLFDKDYTINLINETERYNTRGRQAKLTLRYQF